MCVIFVQQCCRLRLYGHAAIAQFTATVDGGTELAKYSTSADCLTSATPSLFAYSGVKINASQPCWGWCTWTIQPFLAAAISAHHGGSRMAVMLPWGLVS